MDKQGISIDEYLRKLRALRTLPFVSAGLVTANVVIYLLCQLPGDVLYERGCLSAYDIIVNEEYGRIFWSMFLHADTSHLFSNMIILLFMGAMIEKETGHLSFAGIYLASGLGGNLLSLAGKIARKDWAVSLGASGAIFGLDGLLLALVLFSRRRMENITIGRVLLMIAMSLYSGFTGGNVDNLAHIGGLLAGFVLGVLLSIYLRISRR